MPIQSVPEGKKTEVQQYLEQCYSPSACSVTIEKSAYGNWQPYHARFTNVLMSHRTVSVHSAFFAQTQNISDTLEKFQLSSILKRIDAPLFITPTGIHVQDPTNGQRMLIRERPYGIQWPPQSYGLAYQGPSSTDTSLSDTDVVMRARYDEPEPWKTPHVFFETTGEQGVVSSSALPASRPFLVRMAYLINHVHPRESIGAIGRLEMEL